MRLGHPTAPSHCWNTPLTCLIWLHWREIAHDFIQSSSLLHPPLPVLPFPPPLPLPSPTPTSWRSSLPSACLAASCPSTNRLTSPLASSLRKRGTAQWLRRTAGTRRCWEGLVAAEAYQLAAISCCTSQSAACRRSGQSSGRTLRCSPSSPVRT